MPSSLRLHRIVLSTALFHRGIVIILSGRIHYVNPGYPLAFPQVLSWSSRGMTANWGMVRGYLCSPGYFLRSPLLYYKSVNSYRSGADCHASIYRRKARLRRKSRIITASERDLYIEVEVKVFTEGQRPDFDYIAA